MLGRLIGTDKTETASVERGFDSFQVLLGDVMRGERATLGKSLLDVQRELRIKAAYIAAIEDSDPSAFESQGFIAGYVRSYASYLGLDPEWAFQTFCDESGFEGVHGFTASKQAQDAKREHGAAPLRVAPDDVVIASRTSFVPARESIFSQLEPGALTSMAVLVALIGGLSYGGWSVLQEFQRVQVAPVEEAPGVFSELDPLDSALPGANGAQVAGAGLAAPEVEALDRLYRPQALEVPVLTARDAPISTIEPGTLGALAPPDAGIISDVIVTATAEPDPATPQVLEEANDEIVLFAVRPAWVRVRGADGSVLFEAILEAGETYAVPLTDVPPSLHAGNSGSVYFQMNGQTFGPAGTGTSVARNVPLSPEMFGETYALADPEADQDLATVVALLSVTETLGSADSGE